MKQKKCPYCGNRISSSRLESAIPIPATTSEEIVNLKQAKSSTTFETLVKVPLQQSVIYGLFFGLPAAIVLFAIIKLIDYLIFYLFESNLFESNLFVIIPSVVFLTAGISWAKLSNFFNNLLVPFEKIVSEEVDDKPPIINLSIIDKENNTMTTGSIPAEIATTEQIIDFAKNVKRDVERRPRQDIHLTQVRFTKFPSKIFSQPSWTEFIRILEGRKLVERKNRDAKNSSYILTRTGRDFIYKYSELEL